MTETYLYIKQHEITGLKYFGKTTKKDPYKYNGSGKHWLRHIKKHGVEHVNTIRCKLFTDIDELQRVALAMSEMYDIVDSEFWANLTPENGMDGGLTKEYLPEKIRQKLSDVKKGNKNMLGKTLSKATKQKMSEAKKGKTFSDEHKAKISAAKQNISDETRVKMSATHKDKTHKNEIKQKISASMKRIPKQITNCPHCNKLGEIRIMKRWHFDNCKFK